MSHLGSGRIALLIGGLIAVALSLAMQGDYATDGSSSLAGPGVVAIVAIAGVASIAIAVLRGKS